ncbi:hypothetical protein [Nocardioides sp. W7]|uniref:hypothetical protein n=1 Tax=Nocardioides sp. W7 TaxID=2931390 RepID=UPI001FD0A0B4|nr:hypothetical protein [Nocardioides sp. W7]
MTADPNAALLDLLAAGATDEEVLAAAARHAVGDQTSERLILRAITRTDFARLVPEVTGSADRSAWLAKVQACADCPDLASGEGPLEFERPAKRLIADALGRAAWVSDPAPLRQPERRAARSARGPISMTPTGD